MAHAALAGRRADRRALSGDPDRISMEASGGPIGKSGIRFAQYRKNQSSAIGPFFFGLGLMAVLAAGWLNRDQEYIIPDSGLGYWLGVAGGALMLLLLIYPLRKRMRSGWRIGSVAFWFRAHMIFGLIGPALILFHANFRIVSTNSAVATGAMLVVAGSGIIGRYLYGRVHLGLYGRKAAVEEILADVKSLRQSLDTNAAGIDQLEALAARLSDGRNSLVIAASGLVTLSLRAWTVRWRLRRRARHFLAEEAKRRGWTRQIKARQFDAINELATAYLAAVRKAAAFKFYDRLFSIWHLLHVPLFIILIIAASVHVVAAHFY